MHRKAMTCRGIGVRGAPSFELAGPQLARPISQFSASLKQVSDSCPSGLTSNSISSLAHLRGLVGLALGKSGSGFSHPGTSSPVSVGESLAKPS